MDKERIDRDAITGADDTGLVAGERLITDAETLLPVEELHDALPQGHAAHETIDRLHDEVKGAAPNPGAIRKHVGVLRSLPELEATIEIWWEDPKTQRFIANLGQIGL